MQIHIQHAQITIGHGAEILSTSLEQTSPAISVVQPTAAAAAPVPLGTYWHGQGGIYCGAMPACGGMPARHLVFSEAQHEGLAWGCYGEDRPDAKHKHDGQANTAALLRAGKHPAAEWAAAVEADGHSDFHLPSQAELMLAWICAPQAFNPSGYYWTSTQTSPYNAFVVDFEYGCSRNYGKDFDRRVRAVRWVHIEQPLPEVQRHA